MLMFNAHHHSELPNYDLVIPALLEGGIDGLKQNCKLTPGQLVNCIWPATEHFRRPFEAYAGQTNESYHRSPGPFRGQRVHLRIQIRRRACSGKSLSSQMRRAKKFQVHMLEGGEVNVFSRNSENMSAKYPDLVEQVPRVSDGENCR